MTTNETTTPDKRPFEIPQRWLMIVAGVALATILGAVIVGVALWINDGSPSVSASFGFRGAAPRGFQPGNGPGGTFGGQNGPGGGPQQGQQGQQQGQGGGAVPQPGINNNGPPTRNQVPPANNSALSRQPDFTGTVQGISGNTLTITTPNGQRVMRILESTIVYRASGSLTTIQDLTQGSTIAIVTANAPGALTALEIQLLR